MALSESEFQDRYFKLGTLFKPSTPINREDLFAGRVSQRADVVDAINQDGQHIVLYGEPGVGKTSLANMLFPILVSWGRPVITPLENCATNDSYSDIWRRLFQGAQAEIERKEVDVPEEIRALLADYTQQYADKITPDLVGRVLGELGKHMVFVGILDEFNRVESSDARMRFSDTLKYLSDRNVPATIVVIGVSDDVESLISNHRSIERCLVQVRMPRMRGKEIASLVTKTLKKLDAAIAGDALRVIRRLARGLPHYAHLLGLHAGRAAFAEQTLEVQRPHVSKAIRTALEKTQGSVEGDYRRAIASNRKDAQYREVLLASSITSTDEFGYFAPADVVRPLSRILGRDCKVEAFSRHLAAFADEKRGAVLRREVIASGRPRYRFMNPLLQPYVILRGVADGMMQEDELSGHVLGVEDSGTESEDQLELFDTE